MPNAAAGHSCGKYGPLTRDQLAPGQRKLQPRYMNILQQELCVPGVCVYIMCLHVSVCLVCVCTSCVYM